MVDQLFKIEFYVPESHLEPVKLAMFDAGAGRVGDYDACAWQTLGQGQYRPLEGSKPFLGTRDKIETVAEYKVEMVCTESSLQGVIEAMKSSHPYEEVAYCVMRMESGV
ncbi:MAG: NGG1p interacting factor NIF3 [Gammaproteobacteria bacterium]|nr:NGG1p interacting factor NIF3 [Gammaproteobacteria bacterium]MDD9895259.1 NGG1p interacting factor NIF3 [Gammaproteobacteria bacterium]MDD9959271.1 NGG1p interacting factor NIF3 [Gammaproteobacteria bacterium]